MARCAVPVAGRSVRRRNPNMEGVEITIRRIEDLLREKRKKMI